MGDKANNNGRILVWLPSPLGDAVMCTPALKALRENMPDKRIYFVGSDMVRDGLSPCDFADEWIKVEGSVFRKAGQLRTLKFETAILFKNSISCALTVFLAGVPRRVGYYRDGRRIFLTHGIKPPRHAGKYTPAPMMDYYVNLLEFLNIRSPERRLILKTDAACEASLAVKMPQLADGKPLIILVPGGAFGPSKCWPVEHYALAADNLIEKYNARVVVSVAPKERPISDAICGLAKNKLINLADSPVSLGELKALIARASLVITNDTGPRHIAIALNRPVITMFGPNDPEWTNSRHPLEKQLVTDEPCAPCQKPVCPNGDAKCMRNIKVESVCAAAESLLERAGEKRQG